MPSPAYPPELRAAISSIIYDPRRTGTEGRLSGADVEDLIDALAEAAWRELLVEVANIGRAHKAGLPTPWSGL